MIYAATHDSCLSETCLFWLYCVTQKCFLPVKINLCYVGTEGPGVSVSEERQSPAESSSISVIYNPYASLSIEQQRQKLPIFKVKKFFWVY